MEVKQFLESHLKRRGVVLTASLDVKATFGSAWRPTLLKGLREAKCPRKLYYLSKAYLKDRKAVITFNSLRKEKNISNAYWQGSCFSPGLWNIQFNPFLK